MKNRKCLIMFMAVLMLACIAGCSKDSFDTADENNGGNEAAADTNAETYIKFPEFESVTVTGDYIDASIFTEAEITMVNIWGTFCGPCINEMPDLAKLHEELPEGSALIGVLTDVYGEENLDTAIRITDETGVTYDNIVPDEVLYQFLAENITGVPTTLYVDSEGNILGGIVGARSKDEYKAILEELLKE